MARGHDGGLRIALAMHEGLGPAAFRPDQLDRLAAVGPLIDRTPLARFDDERARELLAECDVLFAHWGCPRLDHAALELAPKLRLVAYAGGTVRDFITDAVWERDLLVTSAAAANAVPVAEFTLAVILLANKGAFVSREWYRDRSIDARRPKPVGNMDKRIGLIGASHVGRTVIELLRPFAMTVAVADPYLSDEDAASLGVERIELDELFAASDVVSIHAPDLPSTKGMVGAAQLARMRDGAVLVNTARGALVDEDALIAELETGRISAVLDVTEPEPPPESSPLYRLPNAFLTPHIAGSQGTELKRLADYAIDEVERFASGQPPRYPVRQSDVGRIA